MMSASLVRGELLRMSSLNKTQLQTKKCFGYKQTVRFK
jgi:hypothetical protein